MNRITNYLLFCIALFFGLAIIFDRISKLHLFEGMDSSAPPTGAGAGPVVPSIPSSAGAGADPVVPSIPSSAGAGAGPGVPSTPPSTPAVVVANVKSTETKVKTYDF